MNASMMLAPDHARMRCTRTARTMKSIRTTACNRLTQKPTDDTDENTQEEHHGKTYEVAQQKSNTTISKLRMQIFVAHESEQRSF